MIDFNGEIQLCPYDNCGFVCCKFDQGNYIVLFPGEIDEIDPKQLSHLDIIDDDFMGGKKAVCHAVNTKECDGGYKPLDCRFYPLFPQNNLYVRGEKCPIPDHLLGKHALAVGRYIISGGLEIDTWTDVDFDIMVGYRPWEWWWHR